MNEGQKGSQSIDPLQLISAFKKTLGDSAQDVEIVRLAGDASTRSYWRILKKNSSSTTPKMSWILQTNDPFDLNSSVDSPGAHPFLAGQKILASIGSPVPGVVEVSAKLGWILLEDLGDDTLQHSHNAENYRSAIDLLIVWTLDAHLENPNLGSDVKKLPQFSWAFDTEKLEFEMGFTAEHLFSRFLGLDTAVFRGAARPNSEYLSQCSRYYCHRDYHCRNLMHKNGKLYVIDFQDARMGPITYDIVSLLWDPYVRLSEEFRGEMLAYWKATLIAQAKTRPWIELSEFFVPWEQSKSPKSWQVQLERMKIQRLLKAAGSYASFFNNKGRRDYLPATVPALNDTLSALNILLTEYPEATTSSDRVLLNEVKKVKDAFQQKMGTLK